jgi:hypothetical protein
MKATKNKKTYTKPDVLAIDFTIKSSASSGCAYVGNFADGNNCGYNDNGFIIFIGNCQIIGDKDFCYQVPAADQNVFSS